ncbi:MAG: ParB/RepB/Spo0J family partition protein [Endomicrobiales bacterium]|nr:ParB/RepB/Spo0J family partition protein [Endomicrobiales bacterium]
MNDLSKYQTVWAAISDINVSNTTMQFRKELKSRELLQSLRNDGQKFPVVLWRRHGGELQLISGFRRVVAAKELGWEKVLAVIMPESDLSEDEALRLNFLENVERKSLTNLDMMFACQKLSELGKSNVEIGKLIGKSEAQVRRYIKIAQAPAEVQEKVQSGEASIRSMDNENGKIGLVTRDEWKVMDKNCYVKSIKNGFDAVIKFRKGRDDAEIVKNHIEAINAALKTTLKDLKIRKLKKTAKIKTDKTEAASTGREFQTITEMDLSDMPEDMKAEAKAYLERARREMNDAHPGLLDAIKRVTEQQKE